MEILRLLQLEEDHDRLFGSESVHQARKQDNNNNNSKSDRNNDPETPPEMQDQEPTDDEEPTVDVPATTTLEEPDDDEEEPMVAMTDPSLAPTEEPTKEVGEEDLGAVLGETRIDLVKLVPFDVKLALIMSQDDPLNTFALTDIVSAWMEESLEAQVQRMQLGLTHSSFDSVILEERGITYQPVSTPSATTTTKDAQEITDNKDGNRRQLQASTTIAAYEGVTLWKHTTNSNMQLMTPSLLEDIERQALLNDLLNDDRLLELLQTSSAQGLGDKVQDVRAYINPNPTNYVPIQTSTNTNDNNGSTINANLELIIVVAIVVACMAFAFLVFSLFWAWRFDQQRRDQAYRVENNRPNSKTPNKRKPKANGSTDDSDEEEGRSPKHMNVVVNQDDDGISETLPTTGIYPESVVSEDISTSLSAYYRSGMGSRPLYGTSNTLGNNDFNDQASFSSMESYGYSLDGYAPSLGGNTYHTNKGPAKPAMDLDDDTTTRDP
jgi:hypothetical protein